MTQLRPDTKRDSGEPSNPAPGFKPKTLSQLLPRSRMAPNRPRAAASGSASDASEGEADAAHPSRRRHSPSPIPSRSRSPPPNRRPRAAARSSSPTSAGADYGAASDSDAAGRVRSPMRQRERSPRLHSDSDADDGTGAAGRVASPRRNRERSPRLYSDSDADAEDRVPSPRRIRERSPRLHSDSDVDADGLARGGGGGRVSSPRRNRERSPRIQSDSDSYNSGAAAASEDDGDGNVSPPPRSRRSSRIETSNIKPLSSRLMAGPRRAAAGSSQRGSKRRHSTPEHRKRPPRVWSPEDEVTILRALIEFQGTEGRLPGSIQDTGKLHSQIRGQLTSKAATNQLSDKIRRLKHKYKLLAIRAKNGRDPNLPTAHDRDVYQLSKEVWGSKSDGGLVGGSRGYEDTGDAESNGEDESDEDMDSGWDGNNRTNKKLKALRFENGNSNAVAGNGTAVVISSKRRTSHGDEGRKDDADKGKQMYPYLWEAVEELSKEHPSGPIFRKAFGVLEKSKAQVVEEKLRKFRTSEIRQQLRRMDLMKETVMMVLDALEAAG